MTSNLQKVRRVEGHSCALPQDDELITLYINGGLFVGFRRKFRQYLMVDPGNPEAKAVFKSTAQIRLEESRHLRKYYNMIHPFSQARITWEMVMIVTYSALLLLMPLEIGQVGNLPEIYVYLKFAMDIISMVDIVLFFFTGYYDVKSHKVNMHWKKVLKHYVFSYLIFDIVSSLPVGFVMSMLQDFDYKQLTFLYLLKLVRVPTLLDYIRKFCIRMELYSYKLSIANSVIWFVTLIWWASAITVIVYEELKGGTDDAERGNALKATIAAVHQIVRSFMLVSMSNIQSDSTISMFFNVLCVLIGCVINMIILAQVMQVYGRRSSSRNKYDNLIQEIDEYMNYKELPAQLKNRVFQYVEFKFQKNVFKEGDILNTVSKILKQEILLHNCKKMVEKVHFFRELPGPLILRLVTKLKSEIYLPNDTIVQAGIPGNAMYFIYVGCVAVYTIHNKEICHLEDGSHFGEISLIINEPRVASVVAITNCEVFRLSRKDFLEAIEPYPNLSDRIRDAALERLKKTREMVEKEKKEMELALAASDNSESLSSFNT